MTGAASPPSAAAPGAAAAAARARRRGALLRLLLLAAGLAAAGLVLRELGAAPGTEWVDRHVRGQGVLGEAVFLAVGAVAAAVGVPRQGVAFLGGYAFGAVRGSGLALVAQLLGCALSFYWARLVGRDWAERRLAGRFGRRLRPLRDVLAGSPFGATLAIRLLPVGNNLALNLLAGMAGIAALPYFAGSAIGYVPQTVVFALLGKGVRVDGLWQVALSAALLAASIALGLRLLRRHRAAQAFEEAGPG
ncbi:TVP38/TMEM64 family protein [Caldovatus sediminis]|uniref:TVP38/TMEM64 family membrane protein n=1 Tax=Caldovatus sediminis TaxID=2041189 RepID=A0A8J3EF37_9PROT|nr:VTT domain-containing protein [Caldovatus sediminis]GGG50012.1 TVP38/TMEM64 family protein [Caldovatus sediminis]